MASITLENTKQNIVIDKNGNLKLVNVGETLLPGEIIIKNESGNISVEASDLPEKNDDINAILNAISDGEDPSLITEAPAAGEDSGSSLTVSTEIERIGKSTIAETNFDTSSLESIGLSRTQSLTLLEQYKIYRETGEFQIPDPSNGLVKTAPSISIAEIDENGVISEVDASDGIQVEVTLPAGTEEGDTIELRDGDGKVVGEHLVTEGDITNGKVEITIPTPGNDGDYEYVADITDPSGDSGPISNEVEFELDTMAPGDGEGENGSNTAPIVLIASGDDDTINADEKDAGVTASITLPEGTITTEDSLIISINGGAPQTIKLSEATFDDNGNVVISIPADAIVDGTAVTVDAIVVDAAGNKSDTGTDSADVDLVAPGDGEGDNGSNAAPIVLIASGDDDIINADEKDAGVTATITLPEGTLIAEDSLIISINGGAPQTIKLSEATFDGGKVVISIPEDAIVDGTPVTVDAIVVDAAGNESATGSDTADVDLVAPGDGEGDNGSNAAPIVLIDSGDDDTINADEKDAGVTAIITLPEGTNTAEDSVVVTFSDGTTDTIKLSDITVTDGKFSVTIPAAAIVDGQATEVSAIVIDAAGNESATGSDTADVDLVAPGEGDNGSNAAPIVLIASGDDDIINADEKAAGVTATITLPEGTITTEDSLVISINGGAPQTIKLSDATFDDNGNVVISIPADAIVDGTPVTVDAIVVDAAGNESAMGTDTADVDLVAPGDGEGDNGSNTAPIVLIDSGDDDIINADEKDAGVTVSITLPEGTLIAEDSVVVTFSDGTTDTIKLSDITVTDGKFSVTIPAAAIVDGQATEVSAIVIDAAGNKSETGIDSADVDLVAPGEGDNGSNAAPIVLIASGDDDIINADEKDAGVTATITLPEGTITTEDSLVISINGGAPQTIKLSEATFDDNGKVVISIPADAIVDGTPVTVDAIVVDAAGNESATGTDSADVDLVAPGEGDNGSNTAPIVLIDSGDDDIINADEKDAGVTVSITLPEGTLIAEDSLVISINGGAPQTIKLSEATFDDNGKVVISIPADAIVDGTPVTVDAIVIDAAGNESTTGNDSAEVDSSYGEETDDPADEITQPTVSITDNNDADGNNSEVINATEKADITVSFGEGVSSGSATVVISDSDDNAANDITLTVTLVDGVATVDGGYEVTKNNDGTYTINDVDVTTLADGTLTADATFTDSDGNVATAKDDVAKDTAAPDAPVITNVTDDSTDSDYSTVTLHGTGEPGATITIYIEDRNGTTTEWGTALVQPNGTWTTDFSGVQDKTNYLVRVEQTDEVGNTSEQSDSIQYFNGDFTSTDNLDDYAFLGDGNDTFYLNDDDLNDRVVVDGGAGTDTAVLDSKLSDCKISLNENGEIVIVDKDGDTNIFRDFEKFEFEDKDDPQSVSDLFKPVVTIVDDKNNDGVINKSELEGKVTATFTLPPAAVAGMILLITIDGNMANAEEYTLTDEDIELGTVTREIDVPENGETINVDASMSYEGQTFTDSDNAVMDLNSTPDAIDDVLFNNSINGLSGSYYGYNDKGGDKDGDNLSSIDQVLDFINGNNPDATFIAKKLDYEHESNDLGNGETLQEFLGDDAPSLSTDPGNSTDAILHIEGQVELSEGTYGFRVRADDGYLIKIDGVIVAQYDGNQSSSIRGPGEDGHIYFDIDTAGYHEIEIIYWDQGGSCELSIELGTFDENNELIEYKNLGDYPLSQQEAYASEDSTIIIQPQELLGNDTDSDGDILTIMEVSNPTNGTVSINDKGEIEFKANPNFSGEASFDYTISDGNGGTDTATVTFDIDAVADVPVLNIISQTQTQTQTIFSSSFEDQEGDDGKKFSSGVDGWTPIGDGKAEAIETWENGNNMSHAGTVTGTDGNQFIELNTSSDNDKKSSGGVEQTVNTEEGTLYTLTLDVAPRPGYGEEYNSFDIIVDGVVVGSWSGSSSKDQGLDWSTIEVSFYGSSEPQNIQLVSTGTHHDSGRGVLIDNLVIEEVNGIQLGNNGFVTEISLNDYIGGELVDKDGSETLSYELSNLPADALIFVGDELIPINNGVVELTAEQLSTAKIQLPLSYTGKVSISIVAISTEESNDDQARSEAQIIDWVITDIPNIDNEDVKSEGDLVDAVQVYGAIGTDSEKVQWNGIDVPNPSEGLIVDVGAAGDSVYLGSGNDTIYLGDSHAGGFDVDLDDSKLAAAHDTLDRFSSGSDFSQLQGSTEAGSLLLDSESNAYVDLGHGGGGNDKIFGQNGVDIMFGGSGDDYLNGGNDNDGLRGGTGNDILDGGSGNDILIGGFGDDILVGGTGEDIFKWVDQGVDTGTDTIKDFTVGEDLIDLTEIIGGDDDVINMEDLLSHITVSESGDDLTLSITDDAGNAHEIIVEGAVDSFGLEDANFSNQSEILTKLLNDQIFKLDDIT